MKKTVAYILNHSTYVLADSKDVRNRAIHYYKVQREINIIPWGLKKPRFQKVSRKELGLDRNDFLIVAIGRLVKRKGLDHLLHAVHKTKIPTIKVLLIGEGPEKDYLKFLASELGMGSRVVLTGAVSEEKKFQYLSVSDLFILPSLHEGFGIVFLEAMHCGLPLITTNCGGQTDFIKEGHNGFLVPVGDTEALAGRIVALFQSYDLHQQISANNLEDIKKFSISATAGRYEEIFKTALERSQVKIRRNT